MGTFKIHSAHDIYVDSYEQGELERINGYAIKHEIEANDAWEAIQKYFETILYYPFVKEDASKSDEVENELHYSVLVNHENNLPSDTDIVGWKEGTKKLYSNNITITVYEIKDVVL